MPVTTPTLEVLVSPASKAEDPGRRFELDREVARQDATQRLVLSGWVLDREAPVRRVVLGRNNRELASAALDRQRPQLKKRFPELATVDPAGYHLELEHPKAGRYVLEAESKDGKQWPLANVELSPRNGPRLLYMHIAKTAGSSLNAWFASQFPDGRQAVHVESHADWPARAWRLSHLDFISGHVAMHTLDRHLDLARWYSVTVMRDPWAQLASHLAWIRRLSDPGEEARLARHTEVIQRLSARLAEVNFRSARSIQKWWQGENGEGPGQAALRLLDNCQVRYFTGIEPEQTVTEADAARAIEASARMDRIGTLDTLDAFRDCVALDMGWSLPPELPRENVTREFYGLDTSRARIRRVLEPLVRHDLALYKHVKNRPENP